MFIGSVFPEWRSSAAGVRTKSLIELFLETNRWEVALSSPANPSEFKTELDNMGIKTFQCRVNDSKFDEIVAELKPDLGKIVRVLKLIMIK